MATAYFPLPHLSHGSPGKVGTALGLSVPQGPVERRYGGTQWGIYKYLSYELAVLRLYFESRRPFTPWLISETYPTGIPIKCDLLYEAFPSSNGRGIRFLP